MRKIILGLTKSESITNKILSEKDCHTCSEKILFSDWKLTEQNLEDMAEQHELEIQILK